MQGFPSAVFQRKRRFGEDKAHGNGSCRQNDILSRFNVIIQTRKLACKGFRARYFNGNGGLAKTKYGNGSCRQNNILSRFNVIIQTRKLACKGFRARYFNGNGGLAKTKRMATAVADKMTFCPVSML